MELHVKLYGLLSPQFSENAPRKGLVVDVPSGAKVKDLLKRLDIHPSGNHIVIRDGRVLHPQEELTQGSCVSVFPVVHGG